MYPLNVVLVGLSEQELPHVRRELANRMASIEAECRDTALALDRLRPTRQEPRLFIFELKGRDGLDDLKRLSGSFVGRPVLVLADLAKDPKILLAANRAGATQIVSLPLAAEDFGEALNCISLQFGAAPGDKRVLAVTGAVGGCGATTLAINLAYEIAFLHHRHTVLAEVALQMGVLGTYLDLQPRCTTLDLLRDIDRLDAYLVQQALVRVADNFEVLAGPHDLIAPVAVSAQDVVKLIELTKAVADVIVLDVPCTYDDLYFETLLSADQVVLVGEQKVPSVRALKLVRDTLGPDHTGMQQVVINRYDPRVEGFTAGDLEKLLGVPRLWTVANDYAAVMTAVNHGRALRLEAPTSRALADIDALARTLLGLGEEPQPGAGPSSGKGLFGRLARVFGNT